MIYSSSRIWAQYRFNDPYYFVKRQIIYVCLGFVCMFLCTKIKLIKIKKYNKLFLLIGIISLIMVLIPGIGIEKNGSRSWFSLGSFLIQPSEFFKIILILFVSDYLSNKKKLATFKDYLIPVGMILFAFLLIILQPDFGSGLVMVCSIIVILFYYGVSYRYFIYLMLLGGFGLVLLIISAPYRMERILSFLNPWKDPLGSGFQIIQSLYAIAPGGIMGRGFLNSIQKYYYLPEPQTDFIFAIYCEEFGIIGCILIFIVFMLIIYNGFKIALDCTSSYTSYVSVGIISLFAIQVMINLGVVVGLFPVTGITLPFISYGGSSLIVMLSCFGLLISNIEE